MLAQTEVSVCTIHVKEGLEEITKCEVLCDQIKIVNGFFEFSFHQKDHPFSEQPELL